MSENDWKKRLGVVYSTNPDFDFERQDDGIGTEEEIPPSSQRLIVSIDKKRRAGKQVTLVKGFRGAEEQLEQLAKTLKSKCGVGGSCKEGEIIVQGDFRDKITEILQKAGYNAKRGN